MRKYLLFGVLSMIFFEVGAQSEIGIFVAKNYWIKQTGIGVASEARINRRLSLSADVIYFSSSNESHEDITVKHADGDANLNIRFFTKRNIDLYGVGGLNLHFARRRIVNWQVRGGWGKPGESHNSYNLRTNLGVGINFRLTSVRAFAELIYAATPPELLMYSNFFVKIGIKAPLKTK